MAGNDYEFQTEWSIRAKIEDVSSILDDIESFPRWCPDVYLDAKITNPGGVDGIGKTVQIVSKGKLPYKLHWSFIVIDSRKPNGFTIAATGDFVGSGVWTLTQVGDIVNVVYDWRIRADKPLIRALSPILKPIFRRNHLWAMHQTELGLLQELRKRSTN